MLTPIPMAACGLAAALTLTGCGAGQVSQMTIAGPTVNGTSGTAGEIALRNVHLHAVQPTAFLAPGREVDLVFTAVNNSPVVDDTLLSATSDVGTVTLTGNTTVPAGGLLNVEVPHELTPALQAARTEQGINATVSLTKPITNGLTYDFTFTFQNNGRTTVPVPTSAGAAPLLDRPDSRSGAGHSGL